MVNGCRKTKFSMNLVLKVYLAQWKSHELEIKFCMDFEKVRMRMK